MKSILCLTVGLFAMTQANAAAEKDAPAEAKAAASAEAAPVSKAAAKKAAKKAKRAHHNAHRGHHKVNHHVTVDDLQKRLEVLEKSNVKSNNGYVQAGESAVGFKLGGNVNLFSAYYPGQRPANIANNATSLTTNPTAFLVPSQGSLPAAASAANASASLNGGNRGHLIMAADGTTISSKALGKTAAGDVAANVDLQLLSSYAGGRPLTTALVSDAHVEWNDWVVGYTYSNFADANANGNWLNVNGLQESNISTNNFIVQKNFKLGNNLKLGIALEAPTNDSMQQSFNNGTIAVLGSSSTANSVTTLQYGKSNEPDVTAQLTWTHDRGHVSVRLVERNLPVKYNRATDSTTNFTASKRGYGYGLSAKLKYYGESNLFVQYSAGKGIGGYIGELTNYSALWNTTKTVANGRAYQYDTLKAQSVLVGTEVAVNANWRVNLAYQMNKVNYPYWAIENTYLAAQTSTQLDRYHTKVLANVVWKSDGIEAGLEGGFITRQTRYELAANQVPQDKNVNRGTANFLMLGLKYSF